MATKPIRSTADVPGLVDALTLRGSVAGLAAALRNGVSTSIQVIADSTSNAADEWVYLLAGHLAAAFPGVTVRHHLFNGGTQTYDAPSLIQSGGAERYVRFPGGRYVKVSAASADAITGDVDVRWYGSLDAVVPASEKALVARFGGGGSRAWRFGVTTAGRLLFQWSTDGTALSSSYQSSVNPSWTDGAALWVRATLVVATGQVTFYTSTDGYTWTQLGTLPTAAGATTIFGAASQDVELGTRGADSGNAITGKVYEIDIRAGINGVSTVPRLPEHWEFTGAGEVTPYGAPRLDIINGSVSGANVAYFNESTTRLKSMIPPWGQSLLFISDGHNESLSTPATFHEALTTYVTAVKPRIPLAAIIAVNQNPRIAPAPQITAHAVRCAALPSWAHSNGYGFIDVTSAFNQSSAGLPALVGADGIHPTVAGSALWANTIRQAIGV